MIFMTLANNDMITDGGGAINVYDIILLCIAQEEVHGRPTTVRTVLGKFHCPLGIGHTPTPLERHVQNKTKKNNKHCEGETLIFLQIVSP